MALVAALGLLGGCEAMQLTAKKGPVNEREAIAQAVAPSLVRVEYTLQYDKGEPPPSTVFYGAYLSTPVASFVTQERPMELPGFVLSPTLVVCPDPIIHPRFIKSIAVRCGDQLIGADPSAYSKAQNALFLTLAQPLQDVKPLAFDASAKPPYLTVTYQLAEPEWTIQVSSLTSSIKKNEMSKSFYSLQPYCVLVDVTGKPAGLAMWGSLPLDDSWKGSPLTWPVLTVDQRKAMLADTKKWADQSLLRVALSFRSPKKSAGKMFRQREDEEEESTEQNVTGVLVDDKTVLVLVDLKPAVTARLERILVHRTGGGKPIPATFAGTLKDYGAFIAKLDAPLEGAARLSGKPAEDFDNAILGSAEVTLQGEKRVAYFNHARIASFRLGWRRQVYPVLLNSANRTFLFTPDGELVVLPLVRRVKVAQEDEQGRWPIPTASTYVKTLLAEADRHFDVSNVPLSEEEENRLAWLGVELQALDKELARINNVSELTRDGRIGALVSYVYENSPAAQAGIKPGYILLRLHVEGEPKPLEVHVEDYGFGGVAFPWDRLDEVPEQFYDEIPTPWPPAENNLNTQLTEIGFGKKFRAEFFADGKVITKDFQVVQGPPHYDSAERYKSDALGLTVRNLTYEVRRYFQKAPGEGGVIVSKIEPGSKAAVSGIKPYEIITHVNDQPVGNVKDFEKLIAGQGELRLSVKRMTKGRVVKIRMGAATQPASGPATQPAAGRPAGPATMPAATTMPQ
jgi:S1-C subfamily serine protease